MLDFSECLKRQQALYMTAAGTRLTKMEADTEFVLCVSKKSKVKAVILFLGLVLLPFSYYYWFKYKKGRL